MSDETDEFVRRAWADLPKHCPVCGSKRLQVHTVDMGLNYAYRGPDIPGVIECLDCTESRTHG